MAADTEPLAFQALGLVELLARAHDSSEQRIVSLCRRGVTSLGPVAAVGVPAAFAGLARTTLDQLGAQQAAVVAQIRFPAGGTAIEAIAGEVRGALLVGADEVDVVFPFRALLSGNADVGHDLVAACKAECRLQGRLVVTLETGELRDPQLIRSACRIAIGAGADFIKSCTDRLLTPLSDQAARIMLECIAEAGGQVGFKAAGGLRSLEDVRPVLRLVTERFAPSWVAGQRLRLGGSVLLDDLLGRLGLIETGMLY
ncbi:deoxyribose-phosphate aldolase [uncultured Pseudomonas sp.]|uniref:deoxyribose-phosphate aldolase n=1 Tax=uncultured Pseudomonas sp. TaxID=114707 RepID=UPI0025CE2B40|nr:deoxyribose-phosphate aldolase [uncultured Pseudomonas sp.]